MPLESAKPFGLLSMLIPALLIVVMLIIWPHDKGQSISRHSAQGKTPFLLMAIIQTLAYPAYLWFAFKWLAPTFDLNPLYLVCMVVSAVGLLTAAWVPDVPGIRRKIHEATAYTAAWLFIPSTIIMAIAPAIQTWVRWFAVIVVVYMVVCVIMFFKLPKARDYHLPLQSIYIVSYFAVILLATYVR
jgi:hypothetical protein